MKYLCLLLLIIIGCSTSKQSFTSGNHQGNEWLIPISPSDTSYTNYFNVQPTTTPDGWAITYWVKNDTTRFTDAYIQWQKGDVKRVWKYPHVLEFRPSFLPTFMTEDKYYIYMEHWCATECQALLVLPKNAHEKAVDFEDILGHDIRLGQIVYRIPTETDGELVITATDLKRQVTKSVTFKNKYYSPINAMQDSLIFKGDRIIINWEFFTEDEVKETQIITF
ncbi:MAG: hypothetical protein V4581_16395 [Bacteroidota bacterium]